MSDTATIIGENMRIAGKLSGDEDLNVYGVVEGTIELSEALLVESTGIIRADVSVRSAVISGVVVGNITASEAVELTSIGRMVGDIIAPRIIIADGAAFRGHIEMADVQDGDVPVSKSRTSSRSTKERAAPARPAARPSTRARREDPPARIAKAPVEEVVTEALPVRSTPSRPARPSKAPPGKATPKAEAASSATATATVTVEEEAPTRPPKKEDGDGRSPKAERSPKKPRRKKS